MAPENPDGPEEERVQGGRTSAVWADTEVTAELGSAVTGGRSLTAESRGVNGSSSRSSFSGGTWTEGKGWKGERWQPEGQGVAQRAFLTLHDRT